MRGGEGPPGTVSIWSWSPLFFGCPLNLVLYMPFRIFAYSSNILKSNFDLMESMPVVIIGNLVIMGFSGHLCQRKSCNKHSSLFHPCFPCFVHPVSSCEEICTAFLPCQDISSLTVPRTDAPVYIRDRGWGQRGSYVFRNTITAAIHTKIHKTCTVCISPLIFFLL